MLAAAITALVAAAGAGLTFAICRTSEDTRGLRRVHTEGSYLHSRLSACIRRARWIGYVTSETVTLWVEDRNLDGQANLSEVAVIHYDQSAANQPVTYTYVEPPTDGIDDTYWSPEALKGAGFMEGILLSNGGLVDVWAEGITRLSFEGFPGDDEPQMVLGGYIIGSDDDAEVFYYSARIRAPDRPK